MLSPFPPPGLSRACDICQEHFSPPTCLLWTASDPLFRPRLSSYGSTPWATLWSTHYSCQIIICLIGSSVKFFMPILFVYEICLSLDVKKSVFSQVALCKLSWKWEHPSPRPLNPSLSYCEGWPPRPYNRSFGGPLTQELYHLSSSRERLTE